MLTELSRDWIDPRVHEPSPNCPGQGYKKVARHDGAISASHHDSSDIDLQEFRWVRRIVILLWQVWPELGQPGHHGEIIRKCGATYSIH
jgi:hypothetical protein